MAVKYYCDGCGKNITSLSRVKAEIHTEEDGLPTKHGPWDLCLDCRDKMIPSRWVRPAEARMTNFDDD